jgi:formate dehydrogenase subunit beta
MKQTEHEIINNITKLLDNNTINAFIGYEQGTLLFRTTPCFVYEVQEAKKLVWNDFCTNNLAVYLPRILQQKKNKIARIGILCKGCDSRSLVGLIKEKQIAREQIYIIGISCAGMIDRKKILSKFREEDIRGFELSNDHIIIQTKDGEHTLTRQDFLCEPCYNCAYPVPTIYDMLIRTVQYSPEIDLPDPRVKDLSAKTNIQRRELFEQTIKDCIRCYACRNACPNCYCKECFAEQTDPKWIGVTNNLSDIAFFHMIRIFHQAGRCVDCGACVRACPMDIDLRPFTRMLVDEVKERFGYDPGVSLKDKPPLATFTIQDKQEFITEPE